MTLYYTGVGSRETPPDALELMIQIAVRMRERGWVLRSGGAPGADQAFEKGAGEAKEIFLPWWSFERHFRQGIGGWKGTVYEQPNLKAWDMAQQVHPNWAACSTGARALHARNCHQVLGWDLETPSALVICWTPDGAESEEECTRKTGGTATAIRVASRHNVPVWNLRRGRSLEELGEIVEHREALESLV